MPKTFLSPLSETHNGLRAALVVASLPSGSCEVEVDGEIVPALLSFSCMLVPRPGDQVLLFLREGEPAAILSIIESGSRDPSPRAIFFPEGLEMNIGGRPLNVRSEAGVEIESSEIRILGRRLSGQFAECDVVSGKLTLTGGILSFAGEKIGQVAKTIERVAEWLHDRAHGSIREIETLDRHVSGETTIESESIVSIQSKTALIATEELVKIDSDQIHLG